MHCIQKKVPPPLPSSSKGASSTQTTVCGACTVPNTRLRKQQEQTVHGRIPEQISRAYQAAYLEPTPKSQLPPSALVSLESN